MKTSTNINVLYLDDELSNLRAFKASFRRGFNIYITDSIEEAQSILANNNIQIILTDQRMPVMTGIEFLQSVIDKYPDAIRILITGYSDKQAIIDAINKGKVYKYISKPWKYDEFKILIEQAFEVYQLREKNKQLTKDLIRVNNQLEFMLRQRLSTE